MKKSMYLLVMLMMGLSSALWTGCSDDDDDNNGDQPGTGEEVTEPVVVNQNLDMIDSIQEIWVKNKITFTNDTITAIEKETGNFEEKSGVKVSYAVSYGTNQAIVTYKDEYQKTNVITYTLNKAGNVSSAVLITDSDAAHALNYKFEYNTNGMLEKIAGTSGAGENILKVTYGSSKNWENYIMFVPQEPEEEEEEYSVSKAVEFDEMSLDCVSGTVKNDYFANLNVLGLKYNEDNEVVDCALLCGLIPLNPNILKSISYEGSEMYVFETKVENNKVVELKVVNTEEDGCRIFTLK